MNTFIRLLLAISFGVSLHATTIVPGTAGATQNQSFTTAIKATAFNRASGSFYAGITAGSSLPTIYKAKRATNSAPSSFSAIESLSPQVVDTIEFIALATSFTNTIPNIGYVTLNTTSTTPLTQTFVSIINDAGTQGASSATLFDASGAVNVDGLPIQGIVGLTANIGYLFAAVTSYSLTTSTLFGQPNSGIAIININETPIPNSTQATLALQQLPANIGDNGIKAAEFDITIQPLNLPSVSVNNPLFYDYQITNTNLDFIWDDPLQRMYIPITLQINPANNGNLGGRSIAMGIVDSGGHLTIRAIAPDSAFTLDTFNQIIGLEKSMTDVTQPIITANKVRVMHCTTGPSYLIVNGDIQRDTNPIIDNSINNTIYALPLVDLQNPIDPVQGTLAKASVALVDHKFQTPATASGDLALNTDKAAMVGTGPLPILASTKIGDLFVTGDTVYVSLVNDPSTEEDTGILYSQALFDTTGKVCGWTQWSRRAFPIDGFPAQTILGSTNRMAVDAETGVVWAEDGRYQQTVSMTSWDAPFLSTTYLASLLNQTFGPIGGSTSVLDLDQSTFATTSGTGTLYRYALFGGKGKVAFAVTSEAQTTQPNSPQAVTTDFSQPGYFVVTTVPTTASINVLEYAHQNPGTAQNYFFAGAQDGLYVFGNDAVGNGFDVNALGLLNAAPFIGHNWNKISSSVIPGAIVDIKTTGAALYVLAYSTTTANPMQSTLYLIPFQSDISTMFASGNITTIAQTGTGVFSSTALFTSLQIIMTNLYNNNASEEQIVLTTSQGLYQSNRLGGVQGATSQTDAAWQLIGADSSYYNGSAAVDNTQRLYYLTGAQNTPSKAWPFAFQSPTIARMYNRSKWTQVEGSTGSADFAFIPRFFNASVNNHEFATLPLTTYFWSDGARRIAIITQAQTNCSGTPKLGIVGKSTQTCPASYLFSLPFNVGEWHIAGLSGQELDASILNSIQKFNWIKDIGATGIILAGTNTGVVALE